MDVPKTDYNARNLQWSDRIVRENKVNTRSRSSGFECRKVPSSISAKITRIPGPEQRRRSTMEFMLLKEAASGQTFEFLHQSSAPQSVFLIPQDINRNEAHKASRSPTLTGLYNWRRGYQPPFSGSHDTTHNIGFVTGVGDFSRPEKDPSFTLDVAEPSTDQEPEDSPVMIPGDFHLQKHELAYRLHNTDFRGVDSHNSAQCEALEPSDCKVSDCGRSIPTTVIRAVDRQINNDVKDLKPFMNTVGGNRWHRPLKTNDVSAYGNAYVRTMHATPFSKTQLLCDMIVSRILGPRVRGFCTQPLTIMNRPVSEGTMYFLKALQLVGVLYCVKTYGFDFSTTWGASMSPLIREDGNIVVVDKLTPRFTGYKKGDVVVAAVPTDGHLVLKRICGMQGEAVSTDRLGKRFITIPQGQAWLLGDNRPASLDSRNYGPVPVASIQGRVAAVIWPPSDFRLLGDEAPQ